MNEENLIRLDEVCVMYFNITPKIAARKAAVGTLPIAAFRLSATNRGPMYVLKDALEQHVADRIKKATELNHKMRLAGAV